MYVARKCNQASKCLKTAKSAGHIDHIAVIIDFTIVFKNISDFLCCLYSPKVEKKNPLTRRLCARVCMCVSELWNIVQRWFQRICLISYRFVNRKQRQQIQVVDFSDSHRRYVQNSNLQYQTFQTPRQMVIGYCSMFQCFNNNFGMNKANHSMCFLVHTAQMFIKIILKKLHFTFKQHHSNPTFFEWHNFNLIRWNYTIL